MLRYSAIFIGLAALISSVGCSTCGERRPLFPRLREAFDGPDDATPSRTMQPRAEDRYGYAPVPAYAQPTANTQCEPCAMSHGTVANNGYGQGGYTVPMGYGMLLPATPVLSGTLGAPQLSAPTGPRMQPSRRDDELPPPGGYSTVSPADPGRATAPKPLTNFVGK